MLRMSRVLSIAVASMPLAGAISMRAMTPAPTMALPNCSIAALSSFNITDVVIASATAVAASGPNPDYCDVIGSVATDGEGAEPGAVRFQLDLPAAWNRKYLATGPGGVSGNFFKSMNPVDGGSALRKGYAFVTNDVGHQSDFFDASWALLAPGAPDKPKLVDYFYRAHHQVAVATKALVTQFYGTDSIERAYFDGCSTAGRNGLMEAMREPVLL